MTHHTRPHRMTAPANRIPHGHHNRRDDKGQEHEWDDEMERPKPTPTAPVTHHSVRSVPHHVQSSDGWKMPLRRLTRKRCTSELSLVTISTTIVWASFSFTSPTFSR